MAALAVWGGIPPSDYGRLTGYERAAIIEEINRKHKKGG